MIAFRMGVVLIALLTTFAQSPTLRARFIGQMAFAITDGSATLVTDFPYQIGYADAPSYSASELGAGDSSTLALITHRHLDHWEPALFAKTRWKLAGPADVVATLPKDRVVAMQGSTTHGSIRIDPIETPHARIGHYSYVVTWHGKRLYFSGDTEEPRSALEAKHLDVAFLSPWLYRKIASRGGRIDAKRVVIYHHVSGEQVAGCTDGCVAPRQGDTVEIR